MNSLISTLIRLLTQLLGGNAGPVNENTPVEQGVKPTPASPEEDKPADQPDPDEAQPQPVEEKPADIGPVSPAEGLKFEEIMGEIVLGGQKMQKLKSILISDGQQQGAFSMFYEKTKRNLEHRKWEGLYTTGNMPISDFIRREGPLLEELNMTVSARNVMQAVSDNEGMLEAINAYDGAFMSFGIFQWTLGTRDNKGELPALLKKLKNKYPDSFQQYFGRYGVDISEDTNAIDGYITLNGELINTRKLKDQFRSREWIYRFWRAGIDRNVQAVQIEHALSRLNRFYWRSQVRGFTLNQIITSEYGVGLLLDNHVNLPALVTKALDAAMHATGLTDPTNWGTKEERDVLNAYIGARSKELGGTGPMFNAVQRAKVTHDYVEKGIISDERGSFKVSSMGTRGTINFVLEPDGYNPADYPDVEPDMEDRDMTFLGRYAEE